MDMKVVVEKELRKGWEATSQFRSLLSTPDHLIKKEGGECSSDEERKLASMKKYSTTILNSFDNSISFLKNIVTSMEIEPSSVGQTSNNACPSPKTRRTVIESPDLIPDGHTWRKYGQKSILKTKHPREYYRCAYKDDQNCQATKQVQKISDNPTKYRIIYFAHHTCQPLLNNNNNNVPDFNILDSLENNFTNIISFELKTPTPFSKQNVNNNVVIPNSLPLSNNGPIDNPPRPYEDYYPPLFTTIDHPHPNSRHTTTTTAIMESASLGDDTSACFNIITPPDVLFSPTTFMSPNYMASSNVEVDEDYNAFDTTGQLLDFPLWDY